MSTQPKNKACTDVELSRPPLYMLHGIKSDARWQKLIPSYLDPLFRCIPLTYREYHFLGALKILFWPWAIVVGLMLLFSNNLMNTYSWLLRPIGLITYAIITIAEARWALSFNSKKNLAKASPNRKNFYLTHTLLFISIETFIACVVGLQSTESTHGSEIIVSATLIMIIILEGREAFNSVISLRAPSFNTGTSLVRNSITYIILLTIGGASAMFLNHISSLICCLAVQLLLWLFALLVEPRLRLARTVAKISQQIRQSREIRDERPCLIAHSFGTKIIKHVLESTPGIAIEKMILVGCVLPVKYDWTNLLNDAHIILGDVRNEYGRKDFVVRWLSWFVGFIPGSGLGRAGYSGFAGNENIVHQIDGPLDTCKLCKGAKQRAVHNVALEHYGHNDWFLEINHVRDLWVPHLFGVNPVQYHDFQNLCKKGANALHLRDWGKFNAVEIDLRETLWMFEPNDRIGKYLEDMIAIDLRLACPKKAATPQKAKALARKMAAAVVVILILQVVEACIESEGEGDKNWEMIQWSLNPRKAITSSVNNRVKALRL